MRNPCTMESEAHRDNTLKSNETHRMRNCAWKSRLKNEKAPDLTEKIGGFLVAGAGFEPATSGL